MAKNCCCRCDAVDCTAAWCVTVYAWVRAALKRYDYSSMSRHGPQWRRKKNCQLWTWNFSFGFSLLDPDGMDCIDHHHHSRAHHWLGTHEQGVLQAQLHTILTIVIAVPCLCWSQMGWCVVMEVRCGQGHLVMVWWPTPLVQAGVLRYLSMALHQPHCLCDSHWVGCSHCCCHHLQAQINILSLQLHWHSTHQMLQWQIDRQQWMIDQSSLLCRGPQQTCIVMAIKFYLPRPLIYYV